MPMTEAAIDTGFTRDLYVSLGDAVSATAWLVKVQHKPFIDWIWGGCLLMALGGALAASDRRYRVAAKRQQETVRRSAGRAVSSSPESSHEPLHSSPGHLRRPDRFARGRPQAQSARSASPLIGKSAPHFELPQLRESARHSLKEICSGKVWVLNVWASWCVSCREEHPVLLDLAKSGSVRSTASTQGQARRRPGVAERHG